MLNRSRKVAGVVMSGLSAVMYWLMAVTFATNAQAAEKIVMRIGLPEPELNAQSQGLYAMENYIERSLPGQIDVQIYPNSSLIKQSQLVPALQRGNLEGAIFSPMRFASKVPQASIWGAAYLIRDVQHLCTLRNTSFARQLITQIEQTMGFKALAWTFYGTRTIALREVRDIRTPQDMAGLKIREPGSKAWQTLGRALGANPAAIPYSDIYLAMQTGTVDAFEFEPSSILAANLHEVTKQLILNNHMVNSAVLFTSKDFWGGLSDKHRTVILEGARVYSMFSSMNRIRDESTAVEKMKVAGVKVTVPNVDAFRTYAKTVYANSELSKDWPDGIYEELSKIPTDPNCMLY